MRTPEEKYKYMIELGRSQAQIRAVAVARGDRELVEYVTKKIEEDDEF